MAKLLEYIMKISLLQIHSSLVLKSTLTVFTYLQNCRWLDKICILQSRNKTSPNCKESSLQSALWPFVLLFHPLKMLHNVKHYWQSIDKTILLINVKYIPTHPFNRPPSGTTQVSRYQKVKPIWILLNLETASGSSISWAICKSAPCSRQITTPAPHHSVFYRLDALSAAQPPASKHVKYIFICECRYRDSVATSPWKSTGPLPRCYKCVIPHFYVFNTPMTILKSTISLI